MARRPLYVSRPLLNAAAVHAYARAAGFPPALTAAEMQVTVAFSRATVHWQAIKGTRGRTFIKGKLYQGNGPVAANTDAIWDTLPDD